MTTTTEQPYNGRAIGWTVGVHALLLLLFFFFKYNLGTSDDGSGDDQPMSVEDPAPNTPSSAYRSVAQQSSESNEMETSDEADAPAINNPNPNRNTNRNNTRVTTPTRNNQNAADNNTARPRQPRYVYNGATGTGGNRASENHPGTSEGNTTGHGDRGVPGGTPGADNYTGSPGPGTGGIGHNLSGRNINPRQFSAEFREGGKVVVRVTVNRAGQIVSKTIKTSPSAQLSQIAMQKLSQARFDAKPDAAPEQIGEVTFNFKARK